MHLFIEQLLNGVQFGILLFLIAAGLTLIFGVMDFINLSHGSLFMMGAYFSLVFQGLTGSFFFAIVFAGFATFALGVLLELVLARRLYHRNHLDQVLVTFGLILFANEAVTMIWGTQAVYSGLPTSLEGQLELPFGISYPIYRIFAIGVGALVGVLLYGLIQRTRIGMLVRAGATSRETVSVMGGNISLLFTIVFGLGALLAGIAGAVAGPILSVQPGMGETVLILSFVVVVIGGLGSIRGAFFAAMIVGLVDTLGRAYLRDILSTVLAPSAASDAGPALASMSVYLLMAIILFL